MFVLLPECNIKFLIWLAAGFLAYYNCLRFPPFSRKLFQLLWVCQYFWSAVSCDKCKQWHWCCLAFLSERECFCSCFCFPLHIFILYSQVCRLGNCYYLYCDCWQHVSAKKQLKRNQNPVNIVVSKWKWNGFCSGLG